MIAFEKSVGAILFYREKQETKFLLLHYPSGHWDFPKGHVEKGEKAEETLKREVKEETSIANLIIVPKFSATMRYFYRAKDKEKTRRREAGQKLNVFKKVVFYLAETSEIEVKISFEHIGFAWLSYNEALGRITYPNSKKALVKAQKFLKDLK